MGFELSAEQKDIQKAAREFAEGEFDPDLALDLDQNGKFPESIWKRAARLGFIGLHYPEEFEGQGLGLFENILVIEAFCRADSGIGGALGTVDRGAEVLLGFGSHGQKKALLPSLAKGEKRLSIAFADRKMRMTFRLSPLSARGGREDISFRGQRGLSITPHYQTPSSSSAKNPQENGLH